MTLRHMRIFAEVYRTRNVTHAAQNLHMTQPAVTRAIQELEQHYGVRLFERLYRHLSPTEAAQRLYAQAVYLLDTFDHMEAAMRDWDSLGVVRVGATVTLGSTILPVLARRFAALYPGIELQAKVATGVFWPMRCVKINSTLPCWKTAFRCPTCIPSRSEPTACAQCWPRPTRWRSRLP